MKFELSKVQKYLDPLYFPLSLGSSTVVCDKVMMIQIDDASEIFCEFATHGCPDTRYVLDGSEIASVLAHIGNCNDVPPSVDGPPEKANERWRIRGSCDECGGYGQKSCAHCGAVSACELCSGDGKVNYISDEAYQAIAVCGVTIQRRYAWILCNIPGVKCGTYKEGQGVAFQFDGGRGVVLGFTTCE